MKKNASPDDWASEIRKASDRRDEYASNYDWKTLKEIWDKGARDAVISLDSDHQNVVGDEKAAYVNWLWAFGQTFVPAVYWRQPKINVWPQRSQDMARVKFVQPNINAALQLSRFRVAARRALQDVLVFGHGIVKIGWYTRFDQVPPGPGIEGQGKGQSRLSRETYLIADNAYTYRVHPEHITVDPRANFIEEARWVCQEYVASLDDVKNDPYLKHIKDIKPGFLELERESSFLTGDGDQNESAKDNEKWVRIREIWDRENGQVLFHLHGSEEWNRVISPWPYRDLNGFPFRFLMVTDAIEHIFPPSPVLAWMPLVDELATIRTTRIAHIKKMFKKLGFERGTLTKEVRQALSDPSVDFFDCDQVSMIKEIEGLKPDPNLYASEDSVKSDIREISGFSEILSGSVPFSRIAATTSSIMEKNSTIRFDHYSERLAEFIIDCAKELFKIMRDFQEYPQMVKITGSPDPAWIEFSREDIEGDFEFSIDVEDMSVSSKTQRIKEAFDNLQILSQFPQVVRIEPVVRDYLLAVGKTDFQEYMLPPAGPPLDPNYENQMMLQGWPVPPNPNEDFELHLQVHAQLLENPQAQQMLQQNQKIAYLFNEHIQQTLKLSQAAAQMGASNKPGQGGGAVPSPSGQQGQAQPGSQPIGGPTNGGRGGGMQALNQAMGQARMR